MEEVERLRRQAAHYEELAKLITDNLAQQAARELAEQMRRQAEEHAAELTLEQPDQSFL